MAKKSFLVVICILGFVFPVWNQDGPASLEYLAFGSTGTWTSWFVQPDPTVETNFESPILLTIEVPPSPKCPALFFEIEGQYVLTWTDYWLHYFLGFVGFKFTSPAVPNVEISQAYSVPPSVQETNYAGNHTFPPNAKIRHKGRSKLQLRRGDLHVWWIRDVATGHYLPEEEALAAVDKFIDNGFTVELWAWGTVRGLSYVAPLCFSVDITRIGKK